MKKFKQGFKIVIKLFKWLFFIKLLKWLFFYLYSQYFQWLLERKVKRAVRLSKLENRRYIVTMFFGRPKCYSKKMLKEAIKRRKFKKGITIADIEKNAYFVTN